MMIIRQLTGFERQAVRSFYVALSPEDRRKRFCCSLTDETLAKYVDRLNFNRDAVFAAFDAQAQIVGMAELVHGAKASEMAFSVRPDKRGQKIGTKLMETLLQRASMRGVRKVIVMFSSDNAPMRRMAVRAAMSVRSAEGEACAERELPAPGAKDLARWLVEDALAHSRYLSTLGVLKWDSLVRPSCATAPKRARARAPTA